MKQLLLLLTVCVLTACNATTTPRSGDLRPAVESNEVTMTNLSLGIEYLRQGSYEKALEKLNRAKAADPNYYAIYNVFGLLYQELGSLKQAEENFKKALALNSNDSNTMNNYGRFLCQNGRVEEAEKEFLKAAENPLYDSPEIAIANAGNCAYMNDRKAQAEEYFERALKLNPRVPNALLVMSELNYDRGEYLSARGYLQRYLAVASHTAESLWLGVRIETELGDRDAVSSYALLLRNRFPDSDEAKMLRESGTR